MIVWIADPSFTSMVAVTRLVHRHHIAAHLVIASQPQVVLIHYHRAIEHPSSNRGRRGISAMHVVTGYGSYSPAISVRHLKLRVDRHSQQHAKLQQQSQGRPYDRLKQYS